MTMPGPSKMNISGENAPEMQYKIISTSQSKMKLCHV